MNSQFNDIGIVTRPQTPKMESVVKELINFLIAEGLNVYIDVKATSDFVSTQLKDPKQCRLISKEKMGQLCDLVIVLGGDGTLLSVARELAPYRVPLIGVHQGHLGFLTQVPRAEMVQQLAGMLRGKYTPEERIMLEATVLRSGQQTAHSLALNDVV